VPAAVRLPGLTPDRLYEVRPLELAAARTGMARTPPAWWQAGEVVLSGLALGSAGLRLPVLDPQTSLLLELTAQ
jgi:alpha-galactosidase